MIILIKLILAHLIGDFLLQPPGWVKAKEQKKLGSPKFYLHILTHGLLILFLLWDLSHWTLALAVMVAHGLIDALKLYRQTDRNRSRWFIADQLLHTLSVVALYFLFFQPDWDIRQVTCRLPILSTG